VHRVADPEVAGQRHGEGPALALGEHPRPLRETVRPQEAAHRRGRELAVLDQLRALDGADQDPHAAARLLASEREDLLGDVFGDRLAAPAIRARVRLQGREAAASRRGTSPRGCAR
jgi:hypothetical protein